MTMTPHERHLRDLDESACESVTLGTRLSASDAAVVRANAKALGLTVSKWISLHLEGPIRYARESAAALQKQRRDRD